MPEYYEPIEVLDNDIEHCIEMDREEKAVLCGLLREWKPHKIVEIGLAAGGSTCLIMKCMEMLGLEDFTLTSIDLSERFYRDTNKETGYLFKENKDKFIYSDKHRFLLGRHTVDRMEEIGDNIDFLFLDTVHSLPGEILDFLLLYPHLAKKAVVVLHDTNLHNMQFQHSISNRVLLNSVVADKYYTGEWAFLNIGAFQITEDTKTYMSDVFSALLLPWHYQEADVVLEKYRNEYKKYYSDELLQVWDNAVECMKRRFEKEKELILKEEEERLSNIFSRNKKVLIYGCGYRGKRLLKFLKNRNYVVYGMIVSDGIDTSLFQDISERIYKYSEIPLKEDECEILLAVEAPEVREWLEKSAYRFSELKDDFYKLIDVF